MFKTCRWGEAVDGRFARRNVAVYELKSAGVQKPEDVAKPSNRNDATFLAGVLGSTSLVAVLALNIPGAL